MSELKPRRAVGYIQAPRTNQKNPTEQVLAGKWAGYTPPPLPEK